MPFLARLRILFNRDARLRYTVSEFAHQNKGLLIIVADPKTDRMFVTYKDKFVNGRVKSLTGRKSHVVKDVLKYGRFKVTIDQYIASIAETLNLPVWRANQFYQFLDGAVFNIGKSLRKGPAHAGPEDPAAMPAGSMPSPLSLQDIGRF